MLTSELTQREYTALCEGVAIQLRPQGGVLALGDADRVDFLQRMTTNDIKALRPGQSCVTVLTSPTAKIIHVFAVLARAADLLLLPAPGETTALERYLRSQIFFMDKVSVTNLSTQFTRLRVMGPQAAAALATLGLDLAGAPDGAWQEH